MKVDLKKWLKENWIYLAIWTSMGIVSFWLIARKLGFLIILMIAPFIPSFLYVLIRLKEELS